MHMKRLIALPVSAALCLLCTASCVDTFVGKSIKFSGRTSPEPPATKTAYSGQVFSEGSKKYERIDWVAGDQIKIEMLNGGTTKEMSYDITDVTANGRYSSASLEAVGGNDGLQWGTGEHSFMAAYPSSAAYSSNSFTLNIPATQNLTFRTTDKGIHYFVPDMDKAFMVAGAKYTEPKGEGIDLDFHTAVTTFDFTVGANSEMVVKGFRMETITESSHVNHYNVSYDKSALNGNAVATFNASMQPTLTGPSLYSGTTASDDQASYCSITANFSNTTTISPDYSLNFKLFALPVNIAGVRIIFELNDGATGNDRTASLELKQNGNWVDFTGGNLIRISGLLIPGAVWTITMDGPRVEQWEIHPDIEFGVE